MRRSALGGVLGLVIVVVVTIGFAGISAAQSEGVSTTTPAGPATTIRGTLRADIEGERTPLEGVAITVTQGERVVGETVSDADGSWEVVVASAGTYDVTIDTSTLPEGVGLTDEDRSTLKVTVGAGRSVGAVFRFGAAGAGGGASQLDRAINLVAQGIKLGSVIAITAIGLSLIFGVTGLVNFAHGELVTFGALVAWYLNASSGGPHWHLLVASVVAVIAGGFMGAANERGVWRPLRRRNTGNVAMLVISIGLAMVLRYVYLIYLGAGSKPYVDYTLQRAVSVGPIDLAPKDFAVIGISLAVLVLVALLLQRTRLGTAMRATADNRDLALASGIDVSRVIMVTWIMGGSLAALGGIMQGVTERVTYDMGSGLLLLMFAAVILGGLGTAYGAVVGGLVIGVASQLSTLWISVEFKLVVALFTLIIVLLVRPQGILGRAERVG